MAELDKIERSYTRKIATARLYDGKTVQCTVYTREGVQRGPDVDKAPTQRYLEIMAAGANHFGVDPKYIDWL